MLLLLTTTTVLSLAGLGLHLKAYPLSFTNRSRFWPIAATFGFGLGFTSIAVLFLWTIGLITLPTIVARQFFVLAIAIYVCGASLGWLIWCNLYPLLRQTFPRQE